MKKEEPKPQDEPAEKKNWRLRQSYREQADRLNPHPGITVYDSRGRPKPQTNHHQWLSKYPVK